MAGEAVDGEAGMRAAGYPSPLESPKVFEGDTLGSDFGCGLVELSARVAIPPVFRGGVLSSFWSDLAIA